MKVLFMNNKGPEIWMWNMCMYYDYWTNTLTIATYGMLQCLSNRMSNLERHSWRNALVYSSDLALHISKRFCSRLGTNDGGCGDSDDYSDNR